MTDKKPASPSDILGPIERATADYDWEAVVDLVTKALNTTALSPVEEYDLLRARAKAYDNLIAFSAAVDDISRMIALARSSDDKLRLARVLNMLGWTKMLAANSVEAREAAIEARDLAQTLGNPRLEARALNILGSLADEHGDPAAAEQHFRQVLALAKKGINPKDENWALRNMSQLPSVKNDHRRVAAYLSRSLQAARAGGDRLGEALTLNRTAFVQRDLASRNYYTRQSYNVAIMIDNRGTISMLDNNQAWGYYWWLGLYKQAVAHARNAVEHQRHGGFRGALLYSLETYAIAAQSARDFDLARSSYKELIELASALESGSRKSRFYLLGVAGLGRLAVDQGHSEDAVGYLESAVGADSELRNDEKIYNLGWLTAAYLAQNRLERALDASERALTIIEEYDFLRTQFPLQDLWWWRSHALAELNNETAQENAWLALDSARQSLFERIANIGDEGLRRNYLNKPPVNRLISETWAEEAAQRDLSLAPYTDRESSPAALSEQLQRIVDSGARLAGERDTEKLADFIVQEFVELSGVERAILATRAGGSRDEPLQWRAKEGIDEEEQQVAAFSTPFIEQAALTRAPLLIDSAGEVPSGKLPELHLRSILTLPLVSQGRLWGVLYGDLRHLFGRLNENDRDILSLLANQAGAALENANWVDTLEQQVAERTAEAERANQAKSAFMSNMSHELRTPLNAIIGFTRIVRRKAEGQLPDKQVGNLDKVLSSSEHLLGLINTVLDIAKIEAGRMDIHNTTFPIAAHIEACTAITQPLLKPGVQLNSAISPELAEITTDQDKLKQILLNLLSNAAKFTHEGSITISATEQDHSLVIQVADTGIGMTAQALEHVFEEFQQAESSTRRQYGGTGLGLPISKHLSHLLGGELTVASEKHVGTTFTLTIPLKPEQNQQ